MSQVKVEKKVFGEEMYKALAFIDSLEKKKNKSGRLRSTLKKVKRDKNGKIVRWEYEWHVEYKERNAK